MVCFDWYDDIEEGWPVTPIRRGAASCRVVNRVHCGGGWDHSEPLHWVVTERTTAVPTPQLQLLHLAGLIALESTTSGHFAELRNLGKTGQSVSQFRAHSSRNAKHRGGMR